MAKNPSEILEQITRNTQWTEELLLSMAIKTEEQCTARDRALKNLAEWLAEDIHRLRQAVE